MQERHTDGDLYFRELARTAEKYYLDYVETCHVLTENTNILEVGCGQGGNLFPFAQKGCKVKGIDRDRYKITQANLSFSDPYLKKEFIAGDFFDMEEPGEQDKFDLILVHDVIEHVSEKDKFVKHIKKFLRNDGLVFWRFPAWQMPFGGHQQICKSRICSSFPFLHLLPAKMYESVLRSFGESDNCIDELLDIKQCAVSIEHFEGLMRSNGLRIQNRCLWFINPHYEQKFGLKPRKLFSWLSRIGYLRNFFSTSCYFIADLDKAFIEKE